ncbi:unnamed protein product [Dibothriocephalus latus]|uniref:Uncharacterized protein n=1 Tax=Dibothriocephalus latus TaxID=60516 RepID=A0A3P7Q582_DIBLA|nr:unnamed protein product [Dibothriocephalus latus]
MPVDDVELSAVIGDADYPIALQNILQAADLVWAMAVDVTMQDFPSSIRVQPPRWQYEAIFFERHSSPLFL